MLSYGACGVFVPESHRPGSTGRPWWRRLIRLEADDRLELRSTERLRPELFRSLLARAFASRYAPMDAPVDVADAALGARLSPATRTVVSRAESRPEAFALLLMSPEFQRR